MQPDLYFDISSEDAGGSLYRLRDASGAISFLYEHSTYDERSDDIKLYKTPFTSFEAFWETLTKNDRWFYMHPLFVHPDARSFVEQQLQGVDWTVEGDFKWQESHKRQWKKVLTDPGTYYKPQG